METLPRGPNHHHGKEVWGGVGRLIEEIVDVCSLRTSCFSNKFSSKIQNKKHTVNRRIILHGPVPLFHFRTVYLVWLSTPFKIFLTRAEVQSYHFFCPVDNNLTVKRYDTYTSEPVCYAKQILLSRLCSDVISLERMHVGMTFQ